MYERYFSLARPPFPALPSADRFCETPPSTRALEILTRVANRGEGPCLLLGPPGVGKSAVLAALETKLAEQFKVVRVAQSRVCTRKAFLQQLLYELGLTYQAHDEGQLSYHAGRIPQFVRALPRWRRAVDRRRRRDAAQTV